MTQPAFANHQTHFKVVSDTIFAAADPAEALVRAWPEDPALAERLRSAVLVAAGKASVPMARAAIEKCGVKPAVAIVLAPAGTKVPPSFHAAGGQVPGGGGAGGVRLYEVDHPLPTQRNLIAARAVGDAARLASSRRVPLLALISGGASAHLTFPERGLTLSDIRNITDLLMKSGAAISELNAVRSCCEQLKAGGLARLAAPAPVYAFIQSDVLGDPIEIIASGPTVEVPAALTEAFRVLEARGLLEAVPGITAHLKARTAERAPRPSVTNATNTIIGSNASAVVAARDAVECMGFAIAEARMSVEGEARPRGEELAARLLHLQAKNPGRPLAIVWGGETTVFTGDARGFGGRNQEAALAAALKIAGKPSIGIMCLATDGVDGLSPPVKPPHAGAIVTGSSVADARAAGVDAAAALKEHDSYNFARAAQAAIKTGPTGTNVNDVWVGLAY